jgi:hypothetical protein
MSSSRSEPSLASAENGEGVKKTTANGDRKEFKSGQMFGFGIQKYRLIASVACTARVAAKDDQPQWRIILLYVHLFVVIIWPIFN